MRCRRAGSDENKPRRGCSMALCVGACGGLLGLACGHPFGLMIERLPLLRSATRGCEPRAAGRSGLSHLTWSKTYHNVWTTSFPVLDRY